MSIPITDYDVDEFRRLRHKVDTISGPGVTNDSNNITINPPSPPIPPGFQPPPGPRAILIDTQVSGKQGAYTARQLTDPPDQIADLGVAILPGNFGTDPGSADCYAYNMAEERGGAPIPDSESYVAWGRLAGFADSSDAHPGFPIIEVDAFVSPWQKIAVEVDGTGTSSALPTYNGTYPDGTSFSATNPSFRVYAVGTLVDGGTTGWIYWDNSLDTPAWTLWMVDETAHGAACSTPPP